VRRFFEFAARPRSQFPSLDEPDRLPKAALFTSAQVVMVDSLYQRFSALSPGPVPGAMAAVGMSLTVVSLSSGSVGSSVVPVSVGPLFP
jgi:hypothetical protein